MGRVFKYTIAGAVGAVIAWAIMEPTALMPDDERWIPDLYRFLIGMIAGLLIGLALGLAEAASGLTPKDAKKAIVMGALFGAAGGILGLTLGNAVYNVAWGLSGGRPTPIPSDIPTEVVSGLRQGGGVLAFALLLLGRGFGWAIIGACIGISQGIATSSTRKMWNGAIGGFIGGGLSGSLLEIMAWMNRIPGVNIPTPLMRLIGFAAIGGGMGLFIGCVEELAKQAWLVRLVGNNEGKAIDLYGSRVVIGRSEFADIPIFSDPDVSEKHAAIFTQGKAYYIEDLGSTFGTAVNGDKIAREYLRDGDRISVGKTKFVFHDKATARLVSGSGRQNGSVQIPTSQHVCPFCGSIKDASGNCDCTVGGSQPGAPVQQPAAQSPIGDPTQQASDPFGASAGRQPPASTSPGAARLVAVSGPYSGQTFPLKSGETQVGRDASKDIALPMDGTVSRNHARIAQELVGYVIYDTGSTNGTYVGGVKVQRHELHPGDMVQIGNTKFTFEQ